MVVVIVVIVVVAAVVVVVVIVVVTAIVVVVIPLRQEQSLRRGLLRLISRPLLDQVLTTRHVLGALVMPHPIALLINVISPQVAERGEDRAHAASGGAASGGGASGSGASGGGASGGGLAAEEAAAERGG